jgi:hypothetical protein
MPSEKVEHFGEHARIGHGPAEAPILAVVVCKKQSGYKLIIELPQCENEALRGVLFEDFVSLIDHRHGLGAKVDRGKKLAAHGARPPASARSTGRTPVFAKIKSRKGLSAAYASTVGQAARSQNR